MNKVARNETQNYVVFEILIAVTMHVTIFWDFTLWIPMSFPRRFVRTFCLRVQNRRLSEAGSQREICSKQHSTCYELKIRELQAYTGADKTAESPGCCVEAYSPLLLCGDVTFTLQCCITGVAPHWAWTHAGRFMTHSDTSICAEQPNVPSVTDISLQSHILPQAFTNASSGICRKNNEMKLVSFRNGYRYKHVKILKTARKLIRFSVPTLI